MFLQRNSTLPPTFQKQPLGSCGRGPSLDWVLAPSVTGQHCPLLGLPTPLDKCSSAVKFTPRRTHFCCFLTYLPHYSSFLFYSFCIFHEFRGLHSQGCWTAWERWPQGPSCALPQGQALASYLAWVWLPSGRKHRVSRRFLTRHWPYCPHYHRAGPAGVPAS